MEKLNSLNLREIKRRGGNTFDPESSFRALNDCIPNGSIKQVQTFNDNFFGHQSLKSAQTEQQTTRSKQEIHRQIIKKYKTQEKVKSKQKYRFLLGIVLNALSLLLNAVTIVIYALEVEYIEYGQILPSAFIYTDLLINCYFALEIWLSSYLTETRIKLDRMFMLEILIILSSIITFILGTSLTFGFFRVFKVLTVFKTLKMIKAYKLRFNSNFDVTDNFNHDNVREELVKMVAVLLTSLFLSAGILYFYNVSTGRSFVREKFSFIDSFYFIIGTGIKLGYGDIVPQTASAKFFTVILLIFWIYALSDRLTKIITLLSISKLEKKYPRFDNHWIILGNLRFRATLNFVEELLAEEKLLESENKPQILIITNNTEIIEKIEKIELFRGVVFFLFSEKFGVDDLIQSNIYSANKIFCLNQDISADSRKSDRILNVYLQNITAVDKSKKPKEFFIQYQKLFDDTWLKNENYHCLSLLEAKNSLLAANMFNKGFFPFVCSLFSKFDYQRYNQLHKSDLLKVYLKGLGVKICYCKFPSSLMSMGLVEISLAIYGQEDVKIPQKEEFYRSLPGEELEEIPNKPLLIGSFFKDIFNELADLSYNLTGKTVQTGMYGVFLHHSKREVEYRLNQLKPEHCSHVKPSEFHEYKETELNERFSQETSQVENMVFKVIKWSTTKRIVKSEPLGLELHNHIVILGFTSYSSELIQQMRIYDFYSPILIIDEFEGESKKKKVKQLVNKFSNIMVLDGDYLKLDILAKAKVNSARHVVILNTASEKSLSRDFKSIMASKIIQEHYDTPFTVEFELEGNTRLLGKLPISDDNTTFESEFYPNYFGGKVIFNSLANKMLARANKDKVEFELIKGLVEINKVQVQGEDLDFDTFSQKLRLFSLDVPDYMEGANYKELVHEMLSGEEAIVPLGLMTGQKKRKGKKFRFGKENKKFKTFNGTVEERKISDYFQFLNTRGEVKNVDFVIVEQFEGEMFLTHPPKNFTVGNGMSILCLGEFSKSFDKTRKLFELSRIEAKQKYNTKINKLKQKKKHKTQTSKAKQCVKKLRERISLLNL